VGDQAESVMQENVMEEQMIAIYESLRPLVKNDDLIDYLISLFRLYVSRKEQWPYPSDYRNLNVSSE
jgi:hypothetical protein